MAKLNERAEKYEARAAELRDRARHSELMGTSVLYQRLHKGRVALKSALCALEGTKTDHPPGLIGRTLDALDAAMQQLRAPRPEEK